jgi:hypothetical protein
MLKQTSSVNRALSLIKASSAGIQSTTSSKNTFKGSNGFLFEKGKLTLEKLRDKHDVDSAIEHVNVAFPD